MYIKYLFVLLERRKLTYNVYVIHSGILIEKNCANIMDACISPYWFDIKNLQLWPWYVRLRHLITVSNEYFYKSFSFFSIIIFVINLIQCIFSTWRIIAICTFNRIHIFSMILRLHSELQGTLNLLFNLFQVREQQGIRHVKAKVYDETTLCVFANCMQYWLC